MRLTYFGHSAFQIQTNGTTLLFDPFISGNPHTEGVARADDLNPDVILLTHAHADHWGIRRVLRAEQMPL
jgi:L-ascorbate metabolism protein UlaG (beta-lactamase superfamily)